MLAGRSRRRRAYIRGTIKTIEQCAAGAAAHEVIADGGWEMIDKDARLAVNALAYELTEINSVEGFNEFCTVVEEIQRSIMRAWNSNSEKRR